MKEGCYIPNSTFNSGAGMMLSLKRGLVHSHTFPSGMENVVKTGNIILCQSLNVCTNCSNTVKHSGVQLHTCRHHTVCVSWLGQIEGQCTCMCLAWQFRH